MRIQGIGAGPASLYFSILMKKAFPEAEITLHERNREDDTFGWGVVFSEETLGHFRDADAATYEAITRRFAYWTDIDTWWRDALVTSTGHGFCGMSRRALLGVFADRARELGVELRFEDEIERVEDLPPADLILGGDGVRSLVRDTYESTFQPEIEWGRCRFTWLGTTLPLEAFTFIFRENEHGLFQVHAYPFQRDLSTFIVECHEDVWQRAGFAEDDEAGAVAYLEELFADHLKGHRLLTNKSIWRRFPTVRCATWHHDNTVLLGDAAHTAHFSIGSGTKLAMEDGIALVEAFQKHGISDVPHVLAAYEDGRRLDVEKLQGAAATSLAWFENMTRFREQSPLQLTFNLMSRSKRITYGNLELRDPALVGQVTREFAQAAGVDQEPPPPPGFTPYTLRDLTLPNRVVVSPMCQYAAEEGVVGDWHLVHLGAFATGGAGLVITEMTDVSPEGLITHGCAGLWNDEQEAAWQRVLDWIRSHTDARMGMQIAHAGRKASCALPAEGGAPLSGDRAWETLGPSAIPFGPGWHTPKEMDAGDLERVRDAFVDSAQRAARIGFDVLELHMAHGYLLGSFLSPLSNQREDAYGGDREGRARYPLEVLAAVRAVWPAERPLFVRISATDWLDDDGGFTADDAVDFARRAQEAGADLIDVSTGGTTPNSHPIRYGRMYQVPFAEKIRAEVGMPVMAVGGIEGIDHVHTIIAAGRADLCAIARAHLRNPRLTLDAAALDPRAGRPWPTPYRAALRPAPANPTQAEPRTKRSIVYGEES